MPASTMSTHLLSSALLGIVEQAGLGVVTLTENLERDELLRSRRAYDAIIVDVTPPIYSSGADVYANRGLTVTRGFAGSTAASYSSGANVYKHVVPPAVHALTVASALSQVLQEQAGYRAVSTTGSASRPSETPAGAGLAELRERVAALYGRRARTRVV